MLNDRLFARRFEFYQEKSGLPNNNGQQLNLKHLMQNIEFDAKSVVILQINMLIKSS